MINVILGLTAVLVIVILILFFRVQGLVAVLRGSNENKEGVTNKFNASMFLVFLIVGLVGFFYFSWKYFDEYNLPEAVSVHGKVTDNLFWFSHAIIIFVFVVTQILLLGFAYKYRYNKNNKATFFAESHKLELIWTIIPAIVLTLLVFKGWKAWTDITTVPSASTDKERIELEIVGQQFQWKARYPGADGKLGSHNFRLIDDVNFFGFDLADKNVWDDFAPMEIHLPKGKNVLFRIRSKDVLHSVYAPHFRLKMDAVPGMPTQFYFTPTKTTEEIRAELGNPEFNYEIACAEMCGKSHFNMRYSIVVDEPADYDKWVSEQTAWSQDNADYVLETLQSEETLLEQFKTILPKAEAEVVEVEEAQVVSLEETTTDVISEEAPEEEVAL